MSDLLPAWPLGVTFLLASLVLAITPGPGVFYIVTRSVTQGRRLGLASVAGVALGNLGNALGASCGLAALFAVASWAYSGIKYAGAAYLIYLGINMLRTAVPPDASAGPQLPACARRVFTDGLLVALFNPKTTLFFAAFLPQFVPPPHALLPTIMLGGCFVLIAAITDSLYALCAGALRPWLLGQPRCSVFGKYFSAGACIGLGLFTAVAEPKKP